MKRSTTATARGAAGGACTHLLCGLLSGVPPDEQAAQLNELPKRSSGESLTRKLFGRAQMGFCFIRNSGSFPCRETTGRSSCKFAILFGRAAHAAKSQIKRERALPAAARVGPPHAQ